MKKITIPLLFLFAMLSLSGFGQFQEYVVHESVDKKFAFSFPSGDSILWSTNSSYTYENDSIQLLEQDLFGLATGYQLYFDHPDSVTQVNLNNKYTISDIPEHHFYSYTNKDQIQFYAWTYEGGFMNVSSVMLRDSMYASATPEGIGLYSADPGQNLLYQFDFANQYADLWERTDTTFLVVSPAEIGLCTLEDSELQYSTWSSIGGELSKYTPITGDITFVSQNTLYRIDEVTQSAEVILEGLHFDIIDYYYDGLTMYSLVRDDNDDLMVIKDNGLEGFELLLDSQHFQEGLELFQTHLMVYDNTIYLSGITDLSGSPFIIESSFNPAEILQRPSMVIDSATCIRFTDETNQKFWHECEVSITNDGDVPVYAFDLNSYAPTFGFYNFISYSFQNDILPPGESQKFSFTIDYLYPQYFILEAANHKFLESSLTLTPKILTSISDQNPMHLFLNISNPVSEQLVIEAKLELKYKKGEFRIVDMMGRVVDNWENVNQNVQKIVDVSSYTPGTYVLQYMSQGQILTSQKFIKQ